MKTIIIGFDAFDPVMFERLHAAGKLPHLGKFVDQGGYSPFTVTDPPQSEVSWTSIATGLNPGGHGIFDFVHRNPENYVPSVSILHTKTSAVGTQFVPPHQSQTLFQTAVEDGYPATSMWWPATFPARFESPVQTIPGLGAPDILGRLGVGTLLTVDPESNSDKRKTQIEKLEKANGKFTGWLTGPTGKTLKGTKETKLEVTLEPKGENTYRLSFEKQSIELKEGEWSPILDVPFKVGFGISVHGITRALIKPGPEIYFLPLQIHPLRSAWRYGTPKSFVKDLWNNGGPFLTLGWPQDTTGLDEGCITDGQFLALCDLIVEEREKAFMHQLGKFNEGVLACVFDTLDRLQHMFWHNRQDVVESWYLKLDNLYGRIQKSINAKPALKNANLLIVSDHGFKDFTHKVHLNRWLVNKGYMTPTEKAPTGSIKGVDWSKSQAYGIGLNSLYLNMAGREGQGIVSGGGKEETINKLRDDLLKWKDPQGKKVVEKVFMQEEAFEGPYTPYGPDMVIGYSTGYRASAQTGLGEWEAEETEPNTDHWGADHCYNAAAVPGVLFSNKSLADLPHPSYKDFPKLAIGKELKHKDSAAPPTYSEEDQEALEERLKDLGYL